MSRLVPSQAELADFAFLLRRYHDALSRDWMAGPDCKTFVMAVGTLFKRARHVLSTQDFLAPFG